MEQKPIQRRGTSGIWTFVMETGEGKVLARSEWNTNYEFNKKQWEAMPIIGVLAKVSNLFSSIKSEAAKQRKESSAH